MKEFATNVFTITLVVFLQQFLFGQTFEWAASVGGDETELGHDIVTDNDGNVYTVGWFSGEVDFDPGDDSLMITSNGGFDFFIHKLDASGSFQWVRTIGGTEWDACTSVAVDGSGNVYVTGMFGDTVDFDPGANVYNLVGVDVLDFYVLKLDPDGNFIWATATGGSGHDESNAIAMDDDGNVYTTGYFNDTVDFDPGPATWPLISHGFKDIFIQKLDGDGNFIWAKQIGSTGDDEGFDICFDNEGSQYFTGQYSGNTDFDPGDSIFNLTGFGSGVNAYVLKLDNEGNFANAWGFGGNGQIYSHAIEVDIFGNIFTTGWFEGDVDFDPGPEVYYLDSWNSINVFVQKLDEDGNFVDAISIGWYGHDEGADIHIDESGFIYITGDFTDTVDFDPDIYETFYLTADQQDIFLLILDNNFNFIGASAIGGYSYDKVNSIRADGADNLLLTGSFQSIADFDPGLGVFNLTAVGSSDAFVQKLDITAVGIEKLELKNAFKIFPNPTTGILNIEALPSNEFMSVKIMDISGRTILNCDRKHGVINRIQLPIDNGVFIIEFYGQGGLLHTEKVVKI